MSSIPEWISSQPSPEFVAPSAPTPGPASGSPSTNQHTHTQAHHGPNPRANAHTNANPGPQRTKFRAMTFPRRRAVTACETCRLKKTKCDNRRPQCSSCAKHGWPCSYDPRLDHSSFDPASLLILEKLDGVLGRLDELSSGNGVGTVRDYGGVDDTGIIPTENHDQVQNETGKDIEQQRDDNDRCASSDCLEVPTVFASAERILSWPIFQNKYPPDLLSKEILVGSSLAHPASNQSPSASLTYQTGNGNGRNKRAKPSIDEEDTPHLVERFLERVHCKNPIFEARWLRRAARQVAEDGLSWDEVSCVILLASALGSLAPPTSPIPVATHSHLQTHTSFSTSQSALIAAETYYNLACRRLGLLTHSLLSCQCHVLSGIYLMYTLRPLRGWAAFHQAGSGFSLYLKGRAAVQERCGEVEGVDVQQERRLEQRLYWTILKSECEFRVQLDLPQSDLCKLGYPYLFPSPPSPSSPVQSPQLLPQDQLQHNSAIGQTPGSGSALSPETQLSTMASTVCSQRLEEQSWFYYLSEIALRRIDNRVLCAFYKKDHRHWAERKGFASLLRMAQEIEAQLDNWYKSLPPPIHFSNLKSREQLDELRLVTQGRAQCIRTLLYRPFLYYAIHNSNSNSNQQHHHSQHTALNTTSPISPNLTTNNPNTNAHANTDVSPTADMQSLLDAYAQKALESCLVFASGTAMTHRHHGTWYGLRESIACGLSLVAARRAGIISFEIDNTSRTASNMQSPELRFHGGAVAANGACSATDASGGHEGLREIAAHDVPDADINPQIRQAQEEDQKSTKYANALRIYMAHLSYWEDEGLADVRRARAILEELCRDG